MNVLVTRELLKIRGACKDLVSWFAREFPQGGYVQQIINRAVEQEEEFYVDWLVYCIAPLARCAPYNVDGIKSDKKRVYLTGDCIINGDIDLEGWLVCVGGELFVRGSISAAYIESRYSGIHATGDINSRGRVSVAGTLVCGGTLSATGVKSNYHISAGSMNVESATSLGNIICHGDLYCSHALEAYGDIVICGNATVGEMVCVRGGATAPKTLTVTNGNVVCGGGATLGVVTFLNKGRVVKNLRRE